MHQALWGQLKAWSLLRILGLPLSAPPLLALCLLKINIKNFLKKKKKQQREVQPTPHFPLPAHDIACLAALGITVALAAQRMLLPLEEGNHWRNCIPEQGQNEARLPAFESQHCHVKAACPRTNALTSLCLHFLSYKMGILGRQGSSVC